MTAERADDRRLLHALARVADLVLVVDRAGVIAVAGPSTPAAFGFPIDEAIGMNALDLVHPDDVLLAIEALTSSSEKPGRMEPLALRARDASGGWRSVELVAENCLDDPDIAGMVVTVRDLTGRVDHERALMERDDRYRQVVEMAAEGVWTTDAGGLTTFVTGRMAAMLGYTPEEMVGRSAAEFVANGDQLAAMDRFERRQLGISEQFEFPLRHRDGRNVHTRVSSTPMIGPNGEYLGSIDMISDVTALEDERRRLAASEATHAALIDAVPDLLFHLTADGRFLGYHGDADLLVRAPEAFLDRSMWDVLPQPVAERMSSAMEEALATGSVVTLEYELDIGGVVLTFEGRVSPMDDDELLVLARDVTELRAAQAARLDLALEIEARRSAEAVRRGQERADRLDSLSRLAGGVAHDINNLLGVIGNYTAVLRRSVTEPASVGDLDEIEAAVRRGSSLTRRLMLFGKRRLTEPAACDLGAVVHDVATMMSGALSPVTSLRLDVPTEPCPVMVDRDQVEQALINLVINASEAGASVVWVRLSRFVHFDHSQWVEIAVSDDGTGLAPEARDRAFEPFFTTKADSLGSGLGLSIVHGVVADHGGSVDIGPAPGGGTEVRVRLPAVMPVGGPADPPAVRPPHGGLRVLVVDDDVHALRSAARMLESAGHEVAVATSGAEALARVRDPGRPDVAAVDVALVDVVMPAMSGPALASALREQLPDLPVVLMTGYGADLLGDDTVGLVVLAKPLELEAVDSALRGAAFHNQVATDPSG